MAQGLTVSVPAEKLMASAHKFMKKDFLATSTREVKCESAVNYTAIQIMQLVQGLDKTLSDVPGMTTVGKEIAQCLKPLISHRMREHRADDDISASSQISPDEIKAIGSRQMAPRCEDDEMCALFELLPHDIKVLEVTDERIKDEMNTAADQTAKKFAKKSSLDNYQTIFYMSRVLVNYSPRKKTFDFYYAYVYARDTSMWQWCRGGDAKKKRMTALELEVSYLLGTTLASQSDNTVTALPSNTDYTEEARVLGAN